MKKLLTLAALLATAHTGFAQPAKPSYSYFEGASVSIGAAQNNTQEATSGISKKTNVGISKFNYTFALAYPAKLGLTATADLRNSPVSSTENLAISAPTEFTVEPGILLLSNSLLYAKLGTYNSRYEAGATPSRNLSGASYGIGLKHYVYGQNFIQAEWTQRKADDNPAGLTGVKFKQTTAAVLVGFNF